MGLSIRFLLLFVDLFINGSPGEHADGFLSLEKPFFNGGCVVIMA